MQLSGVRGVARFAARDRSQVAAIASAADPQLRSRPSTARRRADSVAGDSARIGDGATRPEWLGQDHIDARDRRRTGRGGGPRFGTRPPCGRCRAASRVGYVTQSPSVYGDLSVEDNLRYFAAIARADADRVTEVLTLSSERRRQMTASLSGGERARVSRHLGRSARNSSPRATSRRLHPVCTPWEPRDLGTERRKPRLCGAFAFIGETGFEPATARPPAGCATRLRHSPWLSRKRATGIEPALEAWKASVQPQHFARSGQTGS